ncbi:MAG: phenylacetate--CoA ligase family protein [Planctomycetota bacterium]|jgi:phenylacetate-CoA ligase
MQPYVAPRRLSLKARLLLGLLRRTCLTPVGIARYAREHTAHYGRTLRDWDGRSFDRVPLFTKAEARRLSPYDLLAKPLERKVFLYAETTGSAGSPTPAFFTRREFHSATLLTYITPYYPMLRSVLDENRACFNGLAFGFTVAGMSFGDLLANIGGLVANAGSRSTLATPERAARCIARLKPSVVAATPSDFLAWMRILKEDHAAEYDSVVANLKILLSTAELCAASRVDRIAEEFDIEHVDIYACVEGFFAMPCPCGEKHILPAYHAELVDEQGAALDDVGTGRFAFTNLLKKSTPMVRYLLDDWVTIRRSECRYGFPLSVLPHGRYELTARVGDRRIGVRHVEDELFRHGLFGEYEISLGADRCTVRIERYAGKPDGTALRDGLAALLGVGVDVEFVDYGALVDYRAVRLRKPILRLVDRRAASQQIVPAHM